MSVGSVSDPDPHWIKDRYVVIQKTVPVYEAMKLPLKCLNVTFYDKLKCYLILYKQFCNILSRSGSAFILRPDPDPHSLKRLEPDTDIK
jgi:hypothetical protein